MEVGLQQFQPTNQTKARLMTQEGGGGCIIRHANKHKPDIIRPSCFNKLPPFLPVGVGPLGKEDDSEINGRGGAAATYSPHTG